MWVVWVDFSSVPPRRENFERAAWLLSQEMSGSMEALGSNYFATVPVFLMLELN